MATVRSRVHRILRSCENYHPWQGQSTPGHRAFSLGPGEEPLGIYWQPGTEVSTSVLVTDQGLHVGANTVKLTIPYSEIHRLEAPPEKAAVRGFTVELKNGERIFLPIAGGGPRFFDAYEFMRFVQRTASDAARPTPASEAEPEPVGQRPEGKIDPTDQGS